ncbi:MAG: Ig-like domain-containing protein [Ruminococcus sp.]|nr:Ig-like domain-containing protein [Ruminococcus sp.]
MAEFKLRRGLKNVFVAEVTKDDDTGYATGTPFHLIPAGEMTRTVNSDSANVWFDDTIFAVSGTEAATAISVTGASLRAPAVARLLGKTIDSTTGAVIDSGEYVEKYWAFGGEAKGLDGTSELFWFAKGTFTAPEEQDKTIDDSTDTNTMTLSFNAIKTKHTFNGNPLKRVVIDSTTSTLKSGQNWTAQVVTPDNLSTIVQKVVGVTGITLNKSTTTIVAGNDETLTAALTPSGATGSIAWYTSNAAVATVEGGVVTAVAEGTATISAMVDGLADVCEVTVTES